MPPSRRRPIPTPPAGGRPKVAGLNRRTTADPAAEPVAPAVEPVAPAAEAAVAPAAKPVTEPAAEPVAKPAAKPVAKPVAEPVTEPAAKPAAEPVSETAVAPAAKPAAEPSAKPETAPPADPAAEPAESTAAPVADPEAAPESAEEPAGEEQDAPDETEQTPSRNAWLLPAALLVTAVLLGALGTFFLVQSRAVAYDAALVDAGTTSAVNGQVREAVEKSFSYNFADVAATEKAAKELLTGRALCQYNAVFGPVREVAPQQKLVVTVRVVSSAVSSLKDGRATVLVFADQVTTRTTDNQTGGGTAMLRVSAVDDSGRWKIDNMEMFGATAEQNRQLQGC
ncbi:hypothetical protein [Lentzea sp. NPDC060358]|uniref:hypothetical protein n=1 Tax=Lentzea sp. NPDC060358 TaxID=3347103 RepID=UPI0036460EAA